MMLLQGKTCFIDLDGTLYRGDDVIEGAIEFIAYLHHHQIPYYFITNNAMRTHQQNAHKLRSLGFSYIEEKAFFTSAMAAAGYVAHHMEGKSAYYIGQEGLKEALLEQGFLFEQQKVDHVFIGLDMYANYHAYCKAFAYLQQGATFIGTNGDRRLPHGDTFLIGNGAIVEMFRYATNQEGIMIGKPHTPMMVEALRYAGISKENCVIIGDNLETDILFGVNHHVQSVFVTTGVHTASDIDKLQIHPDYVVSNLLSLCHK